MKKYLLITIIIMTAVLALGACEATVKDEDQNPADSEPVPVKPIISARIAKYPVTFAEPGTSFEDTIAEGLVKIVVQGGGPIDSPAFVIQKAPNANVTVRYAMGDSPGSILIQSPDKIENGDYVWLRVSYVDNDDTKLLFYKIKVNIMDFSYGDTDTEWAADTYNAKYRVFPSAPANDILDYTTYFAANKAQPSHWNTQGHNHKYPDLFHFANGNKVRNIADWEMRRKEIFNILQYYMHGKMPSIDPAALNISWTDTGNTCKIDLKHIASNRTATFNVIHTPPAGAVAGARDRIILFGVGSAPTARTGWGTAAMETAWAGSESNRTGTCATLYGLTGTAADTPSINMQYAWVMSVILTVIEEGGFNGYYDPDKVGIYGFSRWGKGAMCIGAFAEGRGGSLIGQTFIGSAGSGGPSLERFIAQAGYKNFSEDPLPVSSAGAMSYSDLKSIIWYQQLLNDTSAAGNNNRGVVRGWTLDTPGIPAGSHVYGEAVNFTVKPYVKASESGDPQGIRDNWGGIQTLAQARNETAGWFSERFKSLTDMHNGLDIDHDYVQTNRGKEGLVCSMPFDAHFLAALIAPRIIYYEDGYDTTRNNPEAQWANWLICDEIYQMYAEELNDPSIIWRNAIKMYHIPHAHQTYQNQDELDLTTAIYSGQQPHAKFRTPPFPVDDPRYRWDFDRMDIGRPGHPTIAERVRKMRESLVPVKAMDTRGLLDEPEPLN